MNQAMLKEILTPGLMLAGFALLAALVLALTFDLTRPQIEENERQAMLQNLNALIDPQAYDNQLVASKIIWPSKEEFHSATPVEVYRATREGEPVAALFVVTSPNGYSGSIRMLVGVKADQTLAGVRVLAHKETPGLGDKIDADRGDWILGFADKSLQAPPAEQWAVKKDGGAFDQFTGATITPRAVVESVKRVLTWSQYNFNLLFTQVEVTQ